MSKIRSVLDIGFTLVQDGTEYPIAVGTEVQLGVAGEEEIIAGIVAGCEIGAARTMNTFGRIYDGVPTYRCGTDTKANIKNAADHYEVTKILVDVAGKDAEAPEYKVVPVDKIESINGTFVAADGTVIAAVADVEALTEAVAAMADGTKVVVNADITLEKFLNISAEGTAELDLNGHEIIRDAATGIYVTGDNTILEIRGQGKVTGAQAVWGHSGITKIYDGVFGTNEEGGSDCIYVDGTGQVEIYGGEFHAIENTDAFAKPQCSCLNIKDADKATASIKVFGGRFYGFDPANNVSENPVMSFVAEGYKSVEIEPGVFEVMVDESYVPPVEEETPAEE